MGSRTLTILGKCSTTEIHLQLQLQRFLKNSCKSGTTPVEERTKKCHMLALDLEEGLS
jgi:hypothetical protein